MKTTKVRFCLERLGSLLPNEDSAFSAFLAARRWIEKRNREREMRGEKKVRGKELRRREKKIREKRKTKDIRRRPSS